ncbi:MAG: DUF2798 domain-containing protein [Treponema sp.]|jgi:hypothetical protein|nr:DUF2798 domain-containing protein [Treponema sp.]
MINLIVTAIYVTVVSFGMTVIKVGFSGVLIRAWLHLYPVFFLAGYIAAFAVGGICFKAAKKIAGV